MYSSSLRMGKLLHALERTPLIRRIEAILDKVKLVLIMAVVSLVTLFLCLLILAAYLLMHLLQGR